MNKKIIIIPIVIIIGIFATMTLEPSEKVDDEIFHVTLADPQLYENGIYSDSFLISEGEYHFRFVPNGSSPETLSISLNGSELDFSEDFKLENTLHQTGISEYYTWEYLGQKEITVSENQQVIIIINPNGNVMGSVSVDILEN